MEQSTYESFKDSWWPFIISGIVGIITFIRNYIGGQECTCDNKITNKIVVITGASSGLGLETAKELAKRGGTIILACRDVDKGNETIKTIKLTVPNAIIEVKQLDLSNITSVKSFAKSLNDYSVIDILINNAGIMFHPYEITSEGFETHFVTNYLGHFLLTHLLLPKLKASENGKIINIAAQAYTSGFIDLKDINLKNSGTNNTIQAFTQSKLAIVLMTRHLGKLLQGTQVIINSVDPGLMRNTNHMNRSPLKTSIPVQLSVWPWMWLFLKTPKQGSQTVIYLAVDPKVSTTTGKLFKSARLYCTTWLPAQCSYANTVAMKKLLITLEINNFFIGTTALSSNCEIKELAENCKDQSIDKELYNLSCSLLKIHPIKN